VLGPLGGIVGDEGDELEVDAVREGDEDVGGEAVGVGAAGEEGEPGRGEGGEGRVGEGGDEKDEVVERGHRARVCQS